MVVQGASDKNAGLDQVMEQLHVDADAICYVGDDWPDLAPMSRCRLAVAVADGCPEVRTGAHWITQRSGGGGAVREVIELILRCQDKWIAASPQRASSDG